MKFRELAITTSLAAVLLWGVGWAQPAPETQQPMGSASPSATLAAQTETSATATKPGKSQKEKHWSGSLVDVTCFAKALSTGKSATAPGTGPTGVPHFMGGDPSAEAGQSQGGMQEPGQPGEQAPSMPSTGEMPSPGMSPADQAKMAQANRVDNAAKQCPATPSTQTFGLAMLGGQVVQFDKDGNAKAAEALKGVELRPGKKVKAKVTGAVENNTTVRVASVEVKGKGKRSSPAAAAPTPGQ